MPLTPDDTEHLARTLVRISTLATHLHGDLHPSHGANDTNTRRPAPGPRPPCGITTLSLLIDAEDRLRQTAGNLAEDTLGPHIPGTRVTPREWAESRATIPTLCDFLRRHLDALATLDWATDAADDITDVLHDLSKHADPPPPPARTLDPALLDTLHSAADIHRLTGIPAGTIRRWGSEGTITKHTDHTGRSLYRLGDALTARTAT